MITRAVYFLAWIFFIPFILLLNFVEDKITTRTRKRQGAIAMDKSSGSDNQQSPDQARVKK